MGKRGEVQKGFLVVVLVILVVAGFSSYLKQGATGYFAWSDFWRSLWGGGSGTLEDGSGDFGPTGINPCLGLGACKPACSKDENCSVVRGTCRCVPKYAVLPGEPCGLEIIGKGCKEQSSCPIGYSCRIQIGEETAGVSCTCQEDNKNWYALK